MKIFGRSAITICLIMMGSLVGSSQTMGVLVARSGIVVKNAPFSADTSSIIVQTLFDGNKITNKNLTRVFRDSEGRSRTERVVSEEEKKNNYYQQQFESITIEDPVAGFNYYLNPYTKTARKVELRPYQTPPPLTVIDPKEKAQPSGYNTTSAALPEKEFEGLICQGLSTTIRIAPGIVGNEREIVMTSESWYSKDLRMTVMIKSTDPRGGDRTYELKNIKREEPGKSLFVVPSGYTILTIAKVEE